MSTFQGRMAGRFVALMVCGVGVALVGGGCERSAPAPKSDQAVSITPGGGGRVMTTFYPTYYFATRIAEKDVQVDCPVPDDADPIFWQPDPATIAKYQSADLTIINGADYEHWVTTAALPLGKLCDSAHGFAAEFLKFEKTTHSHGSSGAHSHEGTDGHTWMDPNNAVRQSEAILAAMTKRWPSHEKAFGTRADALRADLMKLDERLRQLTPEIGNVYLLGSHPAYGYIAKRYGWTVKTVDVPPDSPPSEAQLAALKAVLKDAPAGVVTVMLFESDPIPAVSSAVSAAGVKPAVFRPMETLSAQERHEGADYLTGMNANIDRLASAIKISKGTP